MISTRLRLKQSSLREKTDETVQGEMGKTQIATQRNGNKICNLKVLGDNDTWTQANYSRTSVTQIWLISLLYFNLLVPSPSTT